jgi:hypothetical protein
MGCEFWMGKEKKCVRGGVCGSIKHHAPWRLFWFPHKLRYIWKLMMEHFVVQMVMLHLHISYKQYRISTRLALQQDQLVLPFFFEKGSSYLMWVALAILSSSATLFLHNHTSLHPKTASCLTRILTLFPVFLPTKHYYARLFRTKWKQRITWSKNICIRYSVLSFMSMGE